MSMYWHLLRDWIDGILYSKVKHRLQIMEDVELVKMRWEISSFSTTLTQFDARFHERLSLLEKRIDSLEASR